MSHNESFEITGNVPEAPKKLLEKLRRQVREWANEDGIDQKNVKKYMLNNINVELEAMGYRAIRKL